MVRAMDKWRPCRREQPHAPGLRPSFCPIRPDPVIDYLLTAELATCECFGVMFYFGHYKATTRFSGSSKRYYCSGVFESLLFFSRLELSA